MSSVIGRQFQKVGSWLGARRRPWGYHQFHWRSPGCFTIDQKAPKNEPLAQSRWFFVVCGLRFVIVVVITLVLGILTVFVVTVTGFGCCWVFLLFVSLFFVHFVVFFWFWLILPVFSRLFPPYPHIFSLTSPSMSSHSSFPLTNNFSHSSCPHYIFSRLLSLSHLLLQCFLAPPLHSPTRFSFSSSPSPTIFSHVSFFLTHISPSRLPPPRQQCFLTPRFCLFYCLFYCLLLFVLLFVLCWFLCCLLSLFVCLLTFACFFFCHSFIIRVFFVFILLCFCLVCTTLTHIHMHT